MSAGKEDSLVSQLPEADALPDGFAESFSETPDSTASTGESDKMSKVDQRNEVHLDGNNSDFEARTQESEAVSSLFSDSCIEQASLMPETTEFCKGAGNATSISDSRTEKTEKARTFPVQLSDKDAVAFHGNLAESSTNDSLDHINIKQDTIILESIGNASVDEHFSQRECDSPTDIPPLLSTVDELTADSLKEVEKKEVKAFQRSEQDSNGSSRSSKLESHAEAKSKQSKGTSKLERELADSHQKYLQVVMERDTGDCSSCVAVMLELARGLSHWAHGFKHAVVFLFNTGEEEGLDGAHSFITQHPWNSSIQVVVDLEAMGVGGKSSLFQGGPDPWLVEVFARVAKHPSAQITSQDIFQSGVIKSATDFQVYKEIAGLSGLDFAYMDYTAVYHTENDKLELLQPGSLQHLGDNMLALLLEVLTTSHLQNLKTNKIEKGSEQFQVVYFDVLGKYMIVYSQKFANTLYVSVILQSLLIWAASLVQGGVRAVMSLSLVCLSILMTWTLSLSFSALIAFLLPHLCSSPFPYIANPWLLVGLFGAPALLGALFGHHLGYVTLQSYLLQLEKKKHELSRNEGISKYQLDSIKWEAQRWLFKGGLVQWLLMLMLGICVKAGSSFIAFIWLVSPAVAYGLAEATLSPLRQPRELKSSSLILGLIPPVVLTAGVFLRGVEIIVGTIIRFDRNPGGSAEWFGNVIIAVLVTAVVCLLLVYLLPYAHSSGGLKWIITGTSVFFLLTLAAVMFKFFSPFTTDIGRPVNVVHVVEATSNKGNHSQLKSYISLSSVTPGKLTEEIKHLKDENFICGKDKPVDFVTYSVQYGCVSLDGAGDGWSESDFPVIQVESDNIIEGKRQTVLSVDMKASNRWVMTINDMEIKGFKLETTTAQKGTRETLVPGDDIVGVDGWHTVQFVSNMDGPTHFFLTLFWHQNSTSPLSRTGAHKNRENDLLIKLRTDMTTITPRVTQILEKLPKWCVSFGKSTSPHVLSYLSSFSINF